MTQRWREIVMASLPEADHTEALHDEPDFGDDWERLQTVLAALRQVQPADEAKAMDFEGTSPEQTAALRRAVRTQERWEQSFERLLARQWERRKALVLAKARSAKFRKGTPLWDPPGTTPLADHLDMLVDLDTWDAEITTDTEPMLRDLFSEAVDALEVVESKALPADMVDALESFVRRWVERILPWNRAVASVVRSVLESEPTSDDDLRRRVEAEGDRIARSASTITAISLSTGGVNDAQLQAAKASGVARAKVWFSARDTRVRPGHRLATGQRRGLDEAFSILDRKGNTHALQYPGDPRGPLDTWVHCRCVMLLTTDVSGGLWDSGSDPLDAFGRLQGATKSWTPGELGLDL